MPILVEMRVIITVSRWSLHGFGEKMDKMPNNVSVLDDRLIGGGAIQGALPCNRLWSEELSPSREDLRLAQRCSLHRVSHERPGNLRCSGC